MNNLFRTLLVSAALLLGNGYPLSAGAAPLGDANALRGQHEAKGVFMINMNDPNKLAHVLKVVEETDTGMAVQHFTSHLTTHFHERETRRRYWYFHEKRKTFVNNNGMTILLIFKET